MAIKEERPNYRYSKAEKQHLKRWGNAVLVLLLIVVLGSIYAYLRYDGLGLDRVLGGNAHQGHVNSDSNQQTAKYDFIEDLRSGSGSIFDDIESEATASVDQASNANAAGSAPAKPADPISPVSPVMGSLDGNPGQANDTLAAPAAPPKAVAANNSNSNLPQPFRPTPAGSNTPAPPSPAVKPTPDVTVKPATPPPVVTTKPSVPSATPQTPKQLSTADLGTPLSATPPPASSTPKPAAPKPATVATPKPAVSAPASSAGSARFQVGSYSKPGNAERMRANLAYMGISSNIVNENGLYTVITEARGGAARQQLEQKLKQQGISYFQRR